MSRVLRFLYLATAAFILGCGGPEARDQHLLEAPEDAEQERLRRLQAILILTDAASLDPDGDGSGEISESQLLQDVGIDCSTESCSLTCGCNNVVYQVCLASTLLDMSSIQKTPKVFYRSNSSPAAYYTVPAQTEAANDRLARMAMDRALAAFNGAQSAFAGAVGDPAGGNCTPTALLTPNGTTQNIGDVMAASMTEAVDLVRKATERAVEATLAVADDQRGWTASTQQSVAWAVANSALSRAAAAHLLVGGDPGLGSGYGKGFCTSPNLSPEARRALAILRKSALTPEIAMSPSVSINDVLNATSTNALMNVYGSVRQRFALEKPELLDTTKVPDIAAYFGLQQADFSEARRYMSEEIKAFSRSMGSSLNEYTKQTCTSNAQCPNSSCNTALQRCVTIGKEKRYSATAAPPWPVDPTYWSSIANETTVTTIRSNLTGTNLKVLPEPSAPGYANFFDRAISLSQDILQRAQQLTEPNRTNILRMLNPTALLVTDGMKERPARIVYCTRSVPNSGVLGHTFIVPGYKAGDGLRIVRGEDGLRCATQGSIEGAPCDLATYSIIPTLPLTQDLAGFSYGVMSSETVITVPLNTTARWYAVVPKDGSALSNLGAGSFRALGGYRVRDAFPTGSYYCNAVPVVPKATKQAAEVLAPSREWCARPEVSCAGVKFDERMPLENELTDDNDDIESSWRRYLALARQAADESDALGQEYISSALDADRRAEEVSIREEDQRLRAEAELEQLQEICGTSMEASKLLTLLSAPGTPASTDDGRDLSEVRQTTQTQSQTCPGTPCSTGYVCSMGVCIRNIAELVSANKSDPELSRLNECIDSGPPKYVTPGTAPLCLFIGNGNPNLVCAGATDKCPVLPKNAADLIGQPYTPDVRDLNLAKADCSNLVRPAGGDPRTAVPLGYFDSMAAPVVPSTDSSVCDDIRRLRWSSTQILSAAERANLLNELRSSNLFSKENLRTVAEKIGYRAEYGTRGGVTFEGHPKFHMGSITSTTFPSSWPCGPMINCGTDRTGLFCTSIDCTNPQARGTMNNRLARAVMAAKMMVFSGELGHADILSDVHIPLYVDGTFFGTIGTALVEEFFIAAAPYGNDPIRVRRMAGFSDGAWLHGEDMPTNRDPALWLFERTGVNPTNAAADNAWTDINGNPYPSKATGFYNGITRTKFFGIADVASLSKYLEAGSGTCTDPFSSRSPQCVAEHSFWWDGLPALSSLSSPGWFGASWRDGSPSHPIPGALDVLAPGPNASGKRSWIATERAGGYTWYVENLLDSTQLNSLSVLDAAELMCEIGRGGTSLDDFTQLPPTITSVKDLHRARQYLNGIANQIEATAARAIFANMPDRAIDNLREAGGTGAYPAVGGDLGAAMSRLRAQLSTVNDIVPAMSHEIRQLGNDIDGVSVFVENQGIKEEIINLQQVATTMQRLTECAVALSPSLSVSAGTTGASTSVSFNPGAAAATCANSLAQTEISKDITRLEVASLTAETQQEFINFQRSFENHSEALRGYAQQLQAAYEELDAKLSEIEKLRDKAARVIAQALFMSSFQAEKQEAISTAMQARRDIAKERYARAFKNAKLMAFLAKRAIELRLGMSLEDMRDDLPLVEAPQKWEAGLCDKSGLDYDAISTVQDDGTTKQGAANFADQFIGSYVTKLENLVESYVLTNNFHEGSDTAIVSLRDDVLNVRAPCETDVPNLLYYSSDLSHIVMNTSPQEPGWELRGCLMNASGEPLRDCITTIPTETIAPTLDPRTGAPPLVPFPSEQSHFGENQGFVVRFGQTGADCNITNPQCGFDAKTTSGDPESVLMQEVPVQDGRYRLSWYGDSYVDAPSIGTPTDPGAKAVTMELENGVPAMLGNPTPYVPASATVMPRTLGLWARYFFEFDVSTPQTIRIIIRQPSAGVAAVRLGAFMLEEIGGEAASKPPGAFASTTNTLTRELAVCEDTNGERFRATGWNRRCVWLCPDGFTSECSNVDGKSYCFYETEFNINQSAIDAGDQLVASGFARGNFNYRVESIGVNFVGSGTRDCADSSLPSTCYNAGFIPFSLRHEGPYMVRNHLGQDYEAKLFTGNIEHARGLATERYLSNPMSDADRSLIEPYFRPELEGRPLDGNFVLRVWEEDGVDFEGIQDIQIVLNYRYWTRFD